MYTRTPYDKTVWVSVPDPANLPPDAEPVSSANLNHIENGLYLTRESLHDAVIRLNDGERSPEDPVDLYPAAASSICRVGAPWGDNGLLITYRHSPVPEACRQILLPDSYPEIKHRRALEGARDLWQSNTSYLAGDEVQPSDPNGLFYVCDVAGTSGGTEPVWNTGDTSTTTDGGVTWEVGGHFWDKWYRLRGDALGTTPQTLSSTDAIVSSFGTKLISSAANITLTSAPTIANGRELQSMNIINVGSFTITLQNQGTLANSNLRLSTTTITLGPLDSLRVDYIPSTGDWVETGRTNII